MKVYWAERAGAVIASANLSDNALGIGGLHEAGVLVPSAAVDIDRLIGQIHAEPVTEDALRKLKTAELKRPRGRGHGRHTLTFIDWTSEERRQGWKWGYFEQQVTGFSRRARAAAAKMGSGLKPFASLCCGRGQYREGDWVLVVRLTRKGLYVSPEWLYVNSVVLVEKGDRHYDSDWPFEAFQAQPPRHCPRPPFMIDSAFRRALREASRGSTWKRAEARVNSRPPTRAFVERIRECYNSRSARKQTNR